MAKKIFGFVFILLGAVLSVIFLGAAIIGSGPEIYRIFSNGVTEYETAYAVGYVGAFIILYGIAITLVVFLFRIGVRWIKTKKQPDGEHLPLDADFKA